MKKLEKLIYIFFCAFTEMIGYHIHNNYFYALIDYFFAPIVWIWWIIDHDVNISIIKETFHFFLK